MTETGGLVEPLAHNSTCGHWRCVHCRAQLWRAHGAFVIGIVVVAIENILLYNMSCLVVAIDNGLVGGPFDLRRSLLLNSRHLLKQDASSHIFPLSTFQPSAVDLEAQVALPNFNFSRASRGEHTPMVFLSIFLPSVHSRTSSW